MAPRGQGWKRQGPGFHMSTDGQYHIVEGGNMMGGRAHYLFRWEGKTPDAHPVPPRAGEFYGGLQDTGRWHQVGGFRTVAGAKERAQYHRPTFDAEQERRHQDRINRVPPTPEQIAEGTRRLSQQLGQSILGPLYNDRRSNS